jgi:indole-3-glycerol phosphate synthase
MTNFLKQMAQESAARVAASKVSFTSHALDRPAFPLQLNGFDVIAEIKERSPAEGPLANEGESRVDRAMNYASGGAAAISVLTEPQRFDGQLSHLEEVVGAVSALEIPVMRKDFLVDTAQILEAKAAGASGVLLIAAILSDKELASMLDCAFDNDLFVLLEAFEEDDLERATRLAQKFKIREQAAQQKFLIGINTRDLRSLEVDKTRLERYAPLMPKGVTGVAESGLLTAGDAARVAGWGYEIALVGTALMRADDPAGLIGDSGADAVGFVFADSVRRIKVRDAVGLAGDVPPGIKRVAVMLHPSSDEWQEVRDGFRPDALQTDFADFAYLDVPDGIEQWPVLRQGIVSESEQIPEMFVYEGKASGSGEAVDWQVAARLAKSGKMILAGGLTIANVAEAIREVAPFGVDVSSGVESAPGKKDTTKIQAFIEAVRTAGSAVEEARI